MQCRKPETNIKTLAFYQQGVSLIELMITMLVLGVGLIGVASLQLHAIQANQNSMQRSQAVNLTYDIIDRLRANREQALDSDLYLTSRAGDPRFNAQNFTVQGNCINNFANDPVASFETNDLNSWINSLRCTLPQAQAQILRDANNTFTIAIRWDSTALEGGLDGSDDTEEFITRTQL